MSLIKHISYLDRSEYTLTLMKSSFLTAVVPTTFFNPLKDSSTDRRRPKLWPDLTDQPANTAGYLIQLPFFSISLDFCVTVSLPLSKSVQLILSLSPLTEGERGKKRETRAETPPSPVNLYYSKRREERREKRDRWEAGERINTLNKSRNVLPGALCC